MRAAVDAKEFSQALSKVVKVLKPSVVPVMEGVLVQIMDGRCTITATDFTTWLTTEVPAVGDDMGFVFQRPKDAARACGHFEGELVLETEEKDTGKNRWLQLTMSCGTRAAQIGYFAGGVSRHADRRGAAYLHGQRRPAAGTGGAR